MKKLRLLVIPFMAIPFLASCGNTGGGGGDDPKEKEWYEDTTYINSLTKTDVTKEGGEIQTLMVNGLEHKVRLIGVEEDYEDEAKTKPIHTTWEFVDLISDENGYSLATYWNDTATKSGSNYNYKESTIRKALNGTTNDVNWFRFYGLPGGNEDSRNLKFAAEDNYKISVLDMIDNENKGFKNVLKVSSKFINIYNSELATPAWEEKTAEDKLFLLSPAEMGRTHSHEETKTTAYSYYKDSTKSVESKRIKHQIKWHEGARTNYLESMDLDGAFTSGNKYSFAGHNDNSSESNGGYYWYRSPNTYYDHIAWYSSFTGGTLSLQSVCSAAGGVAPAFCI